MQQTVPHPALFPAALAPEMEALMMQVVAEDGPPVDTTLLPVGEGRALTERLARRWNRGMPDMADVRNVTLDADAALGSSAFTVKVVTPHRARPGAVLFAHGGGFVFCSPATHERQARVLAVESGMSVVIPDYRLAPEHPFPAGLVDVVAALRALHAAPAKFAAAPGPLLVAGDSAGANLALCALLHEQSAQRPGAAGALLFYGVYDADFTTPSYTQFSEGPGLTHGRMQRFWDHYAPDLPQRRDPLASPMLAADAALRALPPLHLMAAGIDPLLSDSVNFAARLKALGRAETLTIVPGVVHGFLQMARQLGAARAALAAAGAAARAMS